MPTASRLERAVSVGAALLYMGAIFAQSSFPLPKPPAGLPLHADKLIHVLEYGLLGLLLHRALAVGLRRPPAAWAPAAVLAALYGVTDELHQAFVPGRNASWGDALADLAGAVLGAALAARLLSGRASRSRGAPAG